jgi:hypothetical protein
MISQRNDTADWPKAGCSGADGAFLEGDQPRFGVEYGLFYDCAAGDFLLVPRAAMFAANGYPV